jgi:AraC-like DNA-binding protein
MNGQRLDHTPRVPPALLEERCGHEIRVRLEGQVKLFEDGRTRLHVPRPEQLMQRRAGMHYHFRPEIFMQLAGETRFRFPAEELVLRAGEIAVVPAGLPHGERALPGEGGVSFRNLVVGFYEGAVSIHFGIDGGQGTPEIEAIRFYSTPDLRLIVEQINYLVQLRHSGSRQAEPAVRGLALAVVSVIADLVQTPTPDIRHESQRVFHIKWVVRDQLYNPGLNVRFIAQRLGCSADHLSHIFHKDTGETLIRYIQRQRMTGALAALDNPRLTVAEIAFACGFADAGYFTRVFRKQTGMTPLDYRKRRLGGSGEEESRPKTVYADRLDYSAGRALERVD